MCDLINLIRFFNEITYLLIIKTFYNILKSIILFE